VGACSGARFEPSAGNRGSLEEWESSDGVLVGWSHLGLLFCGKKKKMKSNSVYVYLGFAPETQLLAVFLVM